MRKEVVNYRDNLRLYLSLVIKHKLLLFISLCILILTEFAVLADQFLLKHFIDKGELYFKELLSQKEFTQIAILLLTLLGVVILIRIIGKWSFVHFSNIMQSRIVKDLKVKVYTHILQLSHKFHSNNKTGSMISKIIRAGGAVEQLSDVLIYSFIPIALQSIFVIGAFFILDRTTAIVILVTGTIFVLYSIKLHNVEQYAKVAADQAEDHEKAYVSDTLTNIDSIKYFAKEKQISKTFDGIAGNVSSKYLKYWQFHRWLEGGHNLILGTGLLVMLGLIVRQYILGRVSLGTVTFAFTSYATFSGYLRFLGFGLRGFYRSMSDIESVQYYLRSDNDIPDHSSRKLQVKKGAITFESVMFKYENKKLFHKFTLDIPKHNKVALVGHSGSGKSSLVKLLFRMYDINEGKITIDGTDISHVTQESLRSQISIVPQECILFDDTVYNNVAFARPNATRTEVIRAMKQAQLWNVVKEFEKKEQTIVGERGVKLSGGEKQRVSIARAILADKRILVLDEATSALDSQTEYDIQKALHTLMKGRTSIIIAHRLSTIMGADNIVVMKKGKIIQQGTHKVLSKQKGEYKHLWNLQKGGYIN
jgi:ABC-type multidrug transport system fused ATPase/permease subunit